jgi:hypothetical protein
MKNHVDKTQANKSQSANNAVAQQQNHSTSTFQFVDNRPEAAAQQKRQEMGNNNAQVAQLRGFQEMADNHSEQQQPPVQRQENNTGLPDNLKTGMESLSGISLDDVKVHRNSAKPAQLQAHAYAQGTDVHLGPGQEKHLPHEAWHVVQQKQGRVKPTMQMKGKVNVNDNAGLEREADVMGDRALQLNDTTIQTKAFTAGQDSNAIQRKSTDTICRCPACSESSTEPLTIQAKTVENVQRSATHHHNGCTCSPCGGVVQKAVIAPTMKGTLRTNDQTLQMKKTNVLNHVRQQTNVVQRLKLHRPKVKWSANRVAANIVGGLVGLVPGALLGAVGAIGGTVKGAIHGAVGGVNLGKSTYERLTTTKSGKKKHGAHKLYAMPAAALTGLISTVVGAVGGGVVGGAIGAGLGVAGGVGMGAGAADAPFRQATPKDEFDKVAKGVWDKYKIKIVDPSTHEEPTEEQLKEKPWSATETERNFDSEADKHRGNAWQNEELAGLVDALEIYDVLLTDKRNKTRKAHDLTKQGKRPIAFGPKTINKMTQQKGEKTNATNAYATANADNDTAHVTLCGSNLLRLFGGGIVNTREFHRGLMAHELCHSLLNQEVIGFHQSVEEYYTDKKKGGKRYEGYWKEVSDKGEMHGGKSGEFKRGGLDTRRTYSENPITMYASSNPEDDLCETARYYFQSPKLKQQLAKEAPGRYAAFEKIVTYTMKEVDEQVNAPKLKGNGEEQGEEQLAPSVRSLVASLSEVLVKKSQEDDKLFKEFQPLKKNFEDVNLKGKKNFQMSEDEKKTATVYREVEKKWVELATEINGIKDTIESYKLGSNVSKLNEAEYFEGSWTSMDKQKSAGTSNWMSGAVNTPSKVKRLLR